MSNKFEETYIGWLLQMICILIGILVCYWVGVSINRSDENNSPFFRELGNSVRSSFDQLNEGFQRQNADTNYIYHVYNYGITTTGDTVLVSESHYKTTNLIDSLEPSSKYNNNSK